MAIAIVDENYSSPRKGVSVKQPLYDEIVSSFDSMKVGQAVVVTDKISISALRKHVEKKLDLTGCSVRFVRIKSSGAVKIYKQAEKASAPTPTPAA